MREREVQLKHRPSAVAREEEGARQPEARECRTWFAPEDRCEAALSWQVVTGEELRLPRRFEPHRGAIRYPRDERVAEENGDDRTCPQVDARPQPTERDTGTSERASKSKSF